MPKIFYTEDEYESLKHDKNKLQAQVEQLEEQLERKTYSGERVGMLQPIQVVHDNFVYQLDKPFEEGGKNLWSAWLSPNNDFNPYYAKRAAKLLVHAEEMLEGLHNSAAAIQLAYWDTRENNEREVNKVFALINKVNS